jgi:hypothetical protein
MEDTVKKTKNESQKTTAMEHGTNQAIEQVRVS